MPTVVSGSLLGELSNDVAVVVAGTALVAAVAARFVSIALHAGLRFQVHRAFIRLKRGVRTGEGFLNDVLCMVRPDDAAAIAHERKPVTLDDGLVRSRGSRSHELNEPAVALKPSGGAKK